MSFYGHQSVQNNTFQELLIFRSRYDANTTVADADSELTGGKMFWVKTIKDYPYVEISHGKPKLEGNEVLKTPTGNQLNYQSTIAANEDLKFGEIIKVPNLKIADTGHIIGATAQSLTLPYIQTTVPITMTGTYTHAPTIGHAIIKQNGASKTYQLAITPSAPSFGQTVYIDQPSFDQWGHFYESEQQQLKIPGLTAAYPITLVTNTEAGRANATSIQHEEAKSVAPTFTNTINTNLTSATIYTTQLGDMNYLSVAGTDNYGHANRQVDLPFQINHSTNYKLQDISSYLTPIAEISSKNEAQTNLRLELRVSYAPGRSYFPVTQNQSNTIDLVLQNNEYNINTTKIPKLLFTIDDTKLNNINWTFTPESNNCIQQQDTTEQLYIIKTIPAIGGTITLGRFAITLSSTEFKQGSLFINGKNQLNQTQLLIINSNSIPDQSADGIEIWDANKLLYLPKLQITDEGHVEKIGDMFIALGNIDNSGNSGNNDNSGGSNNNPINNQTRPMQIKAILNIENNIIDDYDASGAKFELLARSNSKDEFQLINNDIEIGTGNMSALFNISTIYTEFQLKYKVAPDGKAYSVDNDQVYYWVEANGQDEIYSIDEISSQYSKVNILNFSLPVSLAAPNPPTDTDGLIRAQIAVTITGANTSDIASYLTELKFNFETRKGVKRRSVNVRTLKTNSTSTNQILFNSPTDTILLTSTIHNGTMYYSPEFYIQPEDLYDNNNLTVIGKVSTGSDISHFVITYPFSLQEKAISKTVSLNELNLYNEFMAASRQYTSSDRNTVKTNTTETVNLNSTETEMRLSALERNMVQVNTIADPELITKLTSRVELIEGTLAPLGYDDNGAFTSINKLDDISTYKNSQDKAISLEDSYKQLLLCYTGLVNTMANYIYPASTDEAKRNIFKNMFNIDQYKETSYMPAGDIPEIDFNQNHGGN